MIFSARNDKGIPSWQLVMEGKKTVTRRQSGKIPGHTYSVQKRRGEKGIGRILIVSCIPDEYFVESLPTSELENEAHKEGFSTWEDLWECIRNITKSGEGPLPLLYRIEFFLVKPGTGMIA